MININYSDTKKAYDVFYNKSDFRYFIKNDNKFVESIILKYNISGKHGLDLGCGTGWWTYLFNSHGAKCRGLDLSEVGVKNGKIKYPLVDFAVGDAFNLPFKYDSFDFIFCSGLSLFTSDLSERIDFGRYLIKYLKKGGLLIIINSSNLNNKYRSCGWFNYTLGSWREYLLNIGCDFVEINFSHRLFFFLLRQYAISNSLTKFFSRFNFGIKGTIVAIGKVRR